MVCVRVCARVQVFVRVRACVLTVCGVRVWGEGGVLAMHDQMALCRDPSAAAVQPCAWRVWCACECRAPPDGPPVYALANSGPSAPDVSEDKLQVCVMCGVYPAVMCCAVLHFSVLY